MTLIKAGDSFGCWTVESANGRKTNVVCICGTKKTVDKYNLVNGKTKSCGCRGNISPISNTTIYRNVTRANNMSSNNNIDYTIVSNALINQNGLCAVTNTLLNDSNAKLERNDNSLPFTSNNISWVNTSITPVTTAIGVNSAKILSASSNIFQQLGMKPTGDTNEPK